MTLPKKEENDFEIIVLLAAGVLCCFVVGLPVYYILDQRGKGDGKASIHLGLIVTTGLIGALSALISYVCKLEGYTFFYNTHEISTWIPIACISSNLLLLGICELTKPVWIRLPFFKKTDKRESVF